MKVHLKVVQAEEGNCFFQFSSSYFFCLCRSVVCNLPSDSTVGGTLTSEQFVTEMTNYSKSEFCQHKQTLLDEF